MSSEAATVRGQSRRQDPTLQAPAPETRRDAALRVDPEIAAEFSRYQEMRDQVRKQFTKLRRSVIAKYPN